MNGLPYPSGTSYEYPLIIKKLFSATLNCHPSGTVTYRDRITYTYGAFRERVVRLAGALAALGVKKGDVVGIVDYNSHRFLEGFFAVPMMGAVFATFNWRLGSDEFAHTISHASPKVLLVHEDFLGRIRKIRKSLAGVDHLVLIRDSEHQARLPRSVAGEYESMLGKAPEGFDFADFDENTPATLYYTAGTTGLPKGVSFTHRQIVLQTLSLGIALSSYSSEMRFSSQDVFMPLIPMWSEHAWGMPYLATMLGAKQVYSGKYDTECLLKLFGTHKITFSVCVPTALHMILEHPLSMGLDFSSCKLIVTGARLPEKLARAALLRGIRVTSAFGLAEACPLVAMSHLKGDLDESVTEEKIRILGSAGLPAPLVEVGVVDTVGNFKKNDGLSQGQVVIRAPWLAREYHRDPRKTKDLWKHGWLYTGDIGFINKDGYLCITERVRSVIKSGGEWISHLKIENLVRKHKGVKDAAVVGVPNEVWGERPVVLVQIGEEYAGVLGSAKLAEFMQTFVETGDLPKYALPDRYVIVDAIPKTGVQKIDMRVIKQKYGSMMESGD